MKRAQLEANILILVTLGLVAFGLVMVYSATSARAAVGDGQPMFYLTRQAIFACVGLVALVVCARTPYVWWRRVAPTLLAVSIGLLAAVLSSATPSTARDAGFRSARSRSSRPSSRSSRSPSGSPATSRGRAAARRRRFGELAKPLGLVAAVSMRADPARARPGHGRRDRAHARRDARRRRHADEACSSARGASSSRSAPSRSGSSRIAATASSASSTHGTTPRDPASSPFRR